ncbi:MAG: MATE family efflux transporter [Oscillospiraceae bacterium]|nr:MATE family efflux transporter [Oscillospiraceae bacterium]
MAAFQNDLTQGSVTGKLIRFSLPFLLSNVIQALYSVADMLIVSRFRDDAAISGVSLGSQVTMLVTSLVIGFTVGGTVLISQYYGAKKHRDVNETIGTLFTLLAAASVLLTAVFLLVSDPLLRLLQTPPESMPEARAYLRICLYGTVFIFGYNAISAILRGLGDSKSPFFFVLIACAANVGLDLLFVGALGFSADGAALATVLAQGLSLALSIFWLVKKGFSFDFRPASFLPKREKVRLIVRLGLPSSIQNTVSSISFLLMTALANAYGGVDASTAIGVVGKFNSFAILPAVAMSSSVSSMAGQNIGAGYYDRAMKTMWIAVRISLVISVVIFTLVQLFPEAVVRIFSDTPEVVSLGKAYLRAFACDYLLVPFFFCFNGLIIASGHTTFSLINGVTCSVLLRMPVAWLLGYPLGLGMTGIGAGAPAATAGSILLCGWFLFSGRWKHNRLGISAAPEPGA